MTPEIIQTTFSFLAACGVGGIWFRLGGVLRAQETQEKDHTRLVSRVRDLERHVWKGA